MTERSIAIFMYFNLQKQAFEWQSGLIGMNNKTMKHRFNIALNANKNLIEEMEKELGLEDPEHIERFWHDSEYFSKILEIIRNAETPQKKKELIMVMRSFIDGKIQIIEETL